MGDFRVTPWGHHGDVVGASVDDPVLIHRITDLSFPACGARPIIMCTDISAIRWPDMGLCTIHSPYYCYHPFKEHVMRKVAL